MLGLRLRLRADDQDAGAPPSEVNPAEWRCVPRPAVRPAVAAARSRGFAGPLTDALIAPALDLEHLSDRRHQATLADGTLTSAAARQGLHRPHPLRQQPGPGHQPGPRAQPGRDGRGGRGRRGARRRDRARPAGRHPGARQRHDRRRRAADDGRLARAAGPRPGARRRAGREAQGRRRDHPRQGQRDRAQRHGRDRHAGGLRLAARPGAQPVRRADLDQRLERRRGRRGGPGLAAATVGVETDATTSGTNNATNSASISATVPAAATGVAAFRPTFGLISRTGVLPAARSQETPAPVGRSVADIAVLLSGLVGSRRGRRGDERRPGDRARLLRRA